ncbi:MAG: ATP-binding cassette, subfamily bacterial CydD [Euryarchaeota archaeon]|nr:ATP-binding cassette, subfamily bacterial CydD [Euryarchaeota archaeon]
MSSENSQYVDELMKVEKKRGLSLKSGASYVRLFDRRVLGIGRGEYHRLWVIVILGLFISFSYVAQGLLIAAILGNIFSGIDFAGSLPLIVLTIITVMLRWVMLWWNDRIAARTATEIAMSLRRRLINKLYQLGPGWVLTQKSGIIQATIVDGAEAMQNYFGRFLPQALVSLITGVGIVAILVYIDPVIGAIIGLMMAASLMQPFMISRGVGPRMRLWFIAMPRLFSEYVDNLQGLLALKSFNASKRHGEILFRKTEELFAAEIGVVIDEIIWGFPLGLIAALGAPIAIIIGAVRMSTGSLSATELLFVLLLVGEAFRPVNSLRQTMHFSFSGMGAAEGVLDVLEAEPSVKDSGIPYTVTPAIPSISFENVTFRYRKDDTPAVNGFSFSASPGEQIALVGRSGSGKTTVVSLLLRFFDPQAGVIKVGGADIRSIAPESLWSLYSIVSQDTYLFHGTVKENLLLAKPGATQAEIEKASCNASAHEFISSLPNGYDTIIGERGIKLSGGERQRIAIARAILKNAPILILDEATSSVDIANEALIQAALANITRSRTTIVVSHRLSAVRNADRIYVLEKGRLFENGSHEDLMRSKGAYHSLIRHEEIYL